MGGFKQSHATPPGGEVADWHTGRLPSRKELGREVATAVSSQRQQERARALLRGGHRGSPGVLDLGDEGGRGVEWPLGCLPGAAGRIPYGEMDKTKDETGFTWVY